MSRDEPSAIELDIGPELIRADGIKPEPVSWLWEGWLAAGKLHVLAGPPGVGKTTVAIAVAAAISRGGTLPDGSRAPPGEVLIWSAEDDPADTLVPRLLANGADLARVHFVGSNADGVPFDPATNMPALAARLTALPGPPALLIVDPLVSAVTGDSHKNAEVRRSLQPVVDLARETGCAVLGITHYAKGSRGQDPVERVCGSIAFGALGRIVLGMAKLPDDHPDGPGRVLVRAKSNLGDDSGGFRFDLEQIALPTDPLILASRVRWLGPVSGQARDILAEAEAHLDPEERTKVDDAADWLSERLAAGPVPVPVLLREAKTEGYSRPTVYRARDRLRVEARPTGFGKPRVWSLPSVSSVSGCCNPGDAETHGEAETHGAAAGFPPGPGGPPSHVSQVSKVAAVETDAPAPGSADAVCAAWEAEEARRLAGYPEPGPGLG